MVTEEKPRFDGRGLGVNDHTSIVFISPSLSLMWITLISQRKSYILGTFSARTASVHYNSIPFSLTVYSYGINRGWLFFSMFRRDVLESA